MTSSPSHDSLRIETSSPHVSWRSESTTRSRMALGSDDFEEVTNLPDPDALIGRVIADRYRILRRIGRGGMAVVYEVQHIAIGKLLAMKLLSGELTNAPDVVARFEREAFAASRLQCPNTVQVFDYGVSDGLSFLVMELLDGETLASRLRRSGALSSQRVAKIALQVCNALAEAHDRGVVHRDIKPDNVMLLRTADGDDFVKVLDFGLAKLRETDTASPAISQGMILGTPHYMPPEQIRSDKVDGQADIYGLGALMYVALTGQHAFKGRSTEVLTAHLTQEPVPPAQRCPTLGIDVELSRLVVRALRKEPIRRPRGAEGMRALLADFLREKGGSSVERLLVAGPPVDDAGSGMVATRDDVDAYEQRLRKRRYGVVLVMVALMAVAIAAAVWGMASR